MSGQNAVLNHFHLWGQGQGFRPSSTQYATSPLPLTPNPLGVGHPVFSAAGTFTSTVPHRHLAFRMPPLHSEEELATLQKLSNEYEPEIEGPLVGKRQSSQAITTEYENADEIFVRKTAALPQKYSHYRTVKGDGNCGWRAIAFSYFETLLRVGDKNRILGEGARLKSLNNLLNQAGFAEHLYEDFVQETLDLLTATAYSLPTPDDDSGLLKAFNDPEKSNAIITHFRLLTSAWMKTHVDAYQPFLLEDTVEQYCASQIEPYQVEIEHIGMTALLDALILPAGLAVEILYLDRSVGSEVNSHKFEGADNPDAPTFRLLYRPGHYDILYKIEDVAALISQPTAQQTDFQVAFAHTASTYRPFASNPVGNISNISTFIDIPGMSAPFVPVASNGLQPEPSSYPVSPVTTAFPPTTLPLRQSTDIGGFRPSKYEYDLEFNPPVSNVPFQTATFRNSHFNPAHWRNPDFQPEMWSPESADSNRGGGRDDNGRHGH